jgi:hypothetical protein
MKSVNPRALPEDNPAISTSVPAYVNAIAINVAPKVLEAFEKHYNPNDPFAPKSLVRPPHSYAALIGQAILTSEPPQRLLISDIFARIVDRYPFYAANPRLLYNGIRHAMTISEAFVKIDREWGDQSGKARKWGIKPGYEDWFEGGGYAKGGPNAVKTSAPVGGANKNSKNKAKEQSDESDDDEDKQLQGVQDAQQSTEQPKNRARPPPAADTGRAPKRPASANSRARSNTNGAKSSYNDSVKVGSRSSARLRRTVTSASMPATTKWLPSETQASFSDRGGHSPKHIFRNGKEGEWCVPATSFSRNLLADIRMSIRRCCYEVAGDM